MKKPDMQWKPAAVGRYRNGDTIRTDQHRFTEYANAEGKSRVRMLYDHAVDSGENVNISERAQSREIIERLVEQLREQKGKDWEKK